MSVPLNNLFQHIIQLIRGDGDEQQTQAALAESGLSVNEAMMQALQSLQYPTNANQSDMYNNYYVVQTCLRKVLTALNPNDRKQALKQLRTIADPYYIGEICKVWLDSRNSDLEALMLEKQWVAFSPIRVKVFSALKVGKLQHLANVGLREIKFLAEAATDRDPQIAERATARLWQVEQPLLGAMATAWADSKLPLLVDILVQKQFLPSKPAELRVLVALKTENWDALTDGSPNTVNQLVKACESADPLLAKNALAALSQLPNVKIDALCAAWAENRQPFLWRIIAAAGQLPKKPVDVRVLVALKLGEAERVATNGNANVVAPLAAACEDADPEIAERARQVLRQLKKPEAQQELCRLIIGREMPTAQQIAVAAGYMPTEAYQRALFFFVTEQWERYESLDFDYRLLRTAYESADANLRKRLAEKVRAAGRTEFLTVVAGGDYRSRTDNVTADEAELLVQILSANQEWAKLWPLTFELPLSFGVNIIKRLARENWQPHREDERFIFEALKTLAMTPMVTTAQEAASLLPPALQRAKARVSGHVNDVAFAGVRPVIAIGTGAGKVVLWNMQEARREQILSQFEHSIGRLAFLPNDVLIMAEKASTNKAVCNIYGWQGGDIFKLGAHIGPVTAIEAVANQQVLTTGRDKKLVLWDIAERKLVRQATIYDWARAVAVGADGQQLALLHNGMTLVNLPALDVLYDTQHDGLGMTQSAVFAPGGNALIVGKYSGGVAIYQRETTRWRVEQPLFGLSRERNSSTQVQGLAVLPGQPVVLVAESDGYVDFVDWATRKSLGHVRTAGERLTSLRVSSDGAFMALGDSDASFSLWDLRVLGLRALFGQPLAQSQPSQIVALSVALDSAELPTRLQTALKFLDISLRQRFKHDIELDDIASIQAGDFDIEIEG